MQLELSNFNTLQNIITSVLKFKEIVSHFIKVNSSSSVLNSS